MAGNTATLADDFNSSDIEIPERQDEYAHLGGDSLHRALARAAEDRVSSKIAYKQRPIYYGSPRTKNAQAVWRNRFLGFLKDSLNVAPDQMPTSEHIIRFAYAYPKYIEGRGPSGIMAYSSLSDGIALIIITTQAAHPEFKIKPGEATQIKAAFGEMLEQGHITKDESREKKWMSGRLVLFIATAWLRDAAMNGCRARSGDLAQSSCYKGREYAKWGDFTVRLVTDQAGFEALDCLVELRYTKGNKDSSNIAHSIKLELLPPQFNVCDPIKLLVVMALRSGNVAETSIESLLATTRARRNKTMLWKDPTLPILRASNAGHALTYDSPAPESQLRTVLQRASSLGGLLTTPGTHDIRRGVAFEAHHLPSTKETSSHERARRLLGHTNSMAQSGVTQDYIGGAVSGLMEERLQADWTKMPATRLHEQSQLEYKKPKFSTEEVEKYLGSKGPASQNDKRRARRHMAKAHRDEWVKASSLSGFNRVDSEKENEDYIPIDPQLTPTVSAPKRRKTNPLSEADQNAMTHAPAFEVDMVQSEIPVDPMLSGFVESLLSDKVFDMNSYSEDIFDLEPLAAANSPKDPYESTSSISTEEDPFTLSWISFIEHFSKINIRSAQTLAINGGSKDSSSIFGMSCSKGCGFSATINQRMQAHELFCKGKQKSHDKKVPCTTSGCDKTFTALKGMQEHVRTIHNFKPSPCTRKDECDQTIVYPTYAARQKHYLATHCSYKPRTCPRCVGTPKEHKKLPQEQDFRVDMAKVHGLSMAEVDKVLAENLAPTEEETQ
ncbi:hypothetical protein J4E93_004338 [Alternaria ventricosa]|uniref:uncharacterized protein n=1 Tax=Alternaria ventricosa TaxID=1187951 RepID=UPI0020C285F9|nr:uncharacterized protein J4E93_004338 [Alternaria ventricosa]KAI4647927.1 hypothetical protein J4E93_004338 [Alternaria ventricosa]